MIAYGVTDRGVVRRDNQDSFRIKHIPESHFATVVLCDGMGGARGGSVASGMACDSFMSHAANSLDESSTAADMRGILEEAVSFANRQVYDRSFEDLSCMGMGCTLVAGLVSGKRAVLANVGDSRAYAYFRGKLRQITTDHSLVQELVARGELKPEEARTHPRKNVITRAVGTEASVKADLFDVKFPATCRLLLCSDGLSNVVTEEAMRQVLRERKGAKEACEALLRLALAAGAPDNVTVCIIQHGSEVTHGES